MRIILVVLGLSFAALDVSAQADSVATVRTLEATIASLDSAMSAGMARDHIPGGAFVLVSGGRIVASHGFGVADAGTRKRVHPDSTIFGLASTTKLFTAIAAARMSADGNIGLDAQVAPYLGKSPIASLARDVTIARLLTHTAGYDDPTIGSAARNAEAVVPLESYLERNLSEPWLPQRSVTSYSNIGVALAGHVLSVAASTPFAQLLDSLVFAPFGMQRTSAGQPLPDALERTRAVPYHYDGEQKPVSRIYFNDVPASAGYSTAHDMGVLITRLLIPLTAEDSAVASTLFSRRFTNHPALAGMTLGFRESGERSGVYEHGGDWQDYSNSLYIDRDSNTGLFAVFSSENGGETARDLWSIVVASQPVRSAPGFAQPTSVASRCSRLDGTYRDTRMSLHSVAKLGALTGDVQELEIRQTALGIDLNGRSYREQDGGVFRSDDGRTLAFRCKDGGAADYVFRGNAAASSYRRLDAGATRNVQLGLLLFAVIGTIVAVIVDVKRRRSRTDISDLIARVLRVLASIAVLSLLLILAFLLVTANPWDFQYGLPASIAALLRFSPIVAFLAVLAVFATLGGLIRGKAASGVLEVVLVVPVVMLVILMVQWRLIQLSV